MGSWLALCLQLTAVMKLLLKNQTVQPEAFDPNINYWKRLASAEERERWVRFAKNAKCLVPGFSYHEAVNVASWSWLYVLLSVDLVAPSMNFISILSAEMQACKNNSTLILTESGSLILLYPAFASDKFVLFYQPIAVKSGLLVSEGFEARKKQQHFDVRLLGEITVGKRLMTSALVSSTVRKMFQAESDKSNSKGVTHIQEQLEEIAFRLLAESRIAREKLIRWRHFGENSFCD